MEAVSSESSPPSSIDDGLYAGPELIHKSRNSNISKLTLTQKPKLAFPPSHSPIWGEINKELDSGLPTVFNATVIRNHDITALSEKFDSWLYGFFLDHFGEEVRSENPPKSSPGKKLHHRGLEKLRRRKTDCKKARKALHKAGHAGTPQDKLLTQRWFALVRDHSRLRRAVTKRTQARESAACERRFKKNPHEFASKLFNPQGQMARQHFQEKRHKSISVRLMAIPAEVMNTCLFLNQNDLLCQSPLSLGDAHRKPS